MAVRELKSYKVWDVPTRLFHWVNVGCFLALVVVGTVIYWNKALGISTDGKILLKTVHVWIGYVFALNLGWRIVWAFVGNRFARWPSIVPFGRGFIRQTRDYLGGLARGDAPAYLGHNPVSKAMVALLLLLLCSQAVTGLVLAGTDIFYPPFGAWIAAWIAAPGVDPSALVPYDKASVDAQAYAAMREFRAPFIIVHVYGFFILLGAVVVHIAGVVVTELKEGNGLVSAMITGRKVLDKAPVDGDENSG